MPDLILLGNEALLSKNYQLAIDEYTKAIEFNPCEPIFYSNRAAAWMHLKSEDANALSNAEKDCLKALELDPKYTKAQVRLGSVLLAQKKYKSAVDILEKASLADPTNESITSQLAEAKALLSNEHPSSKDAAPNAPGFDLSSLLSDPNLMSMAQNFMSSDAAKGLLNNPNIANLASQFLGSGMKGNGPPK